MEIRKKIAFITALSLSVTLLAGCGPLDGDGMERENVPEVTEEVVTDITEVSASSEVTSADTGKTGKKEFTDYEDMIRALYEAKNNCDFESVNNYMYPSKIADYMCSQITDEYKADVNNLSIYEITDIVTQGEMSSEDLEAVNLGYNKLYGIYSKLESEGKTIDDLTYEEEKELSETFYKGSSDTTYPKEFNITKGYEVRVDYLDNGEYALDDIPYSEYYYVFYIEGEGWKLNSIMRLFRSMEKYDQTVEQNMINYKGQTLSSSSTGAIAHMIKKGIDVSGTYIISSDPAKDINLPSGLDADTVREAMDYSTVDSTDTNYEYFILVKDGICLYSVFQRNGDKLGIGIYPELSVPVSINEETLDTKSIDSLDGYSIDVLYDICVNLVK